jgi:sRNA-binding regulator protein Hfq
MTEEPKRKPLDFLSGLKGKRVTMRMAVGGPPMIGTITDYNPYEILLQTPKGQVLLFKHGIASIEIMDEAKDR